ncbi:MAG: phycobilisome rod-core linker polypeptide [Cyanobacteria bacterium P01_D01_bin.115]
MRAVYCQVLDPADGRASERLAVPESQLPWGELSIREFVPAVVKFRP